MHSWMIAFIAGIFSMLFWQELPSLFLLLIPLSLSLTIILLKRYFDKGILCYFFILLSFSVGVSWVLLKVYWLLSWQLPIGAEKQDILITGQICSIPQLKPRNIRFNFCLDSIEGRKVAFFQSPKLRLSWYSTKMRPRIGETWQYQVRLKPPHGMLNPGGFDYEKWLFQNQIRAVGYIKKSHSNIKLLNTPWYKSDYWRQKLKDFIRKNLEDREFTSVVEALALGSRENLSEQHWKLFSATGTSHLMAISGLHIGLVAGFAFFLVNGLWSRSSKACLLIAAPRVGILAALFCAWLYSWLAGFAIPCQRAFLMLMVFSVYQWFYLKISFFTLLLIALFVVLVFDPLAVLSPGFWLSFAAVAIIGLVIVKQKHPKQKYDNYLGEDESWKKTVNKVKFIGGAWFKIQLLLFLGMLPLSLLFFKQVALLAPIANLVSVPWVSFVSVPLILFAILLFPVSQSLSICLFQLAESSLAVLAAYLQYLANWDLQLSLFNTLNVYSLLALLIFSCLIILPRLKWTYPLIFCFSVLSIFSVCLTPQKSEFKLTVLDVGQGLSLVVEVDSKVLIYDAGYAGENFNLGSQVINPFIKQLGKQSIDLLLISHKDKDHIGGAEAIIEEFNPEVIYGDFSDYPHINAQLCKAGLKWYWGEVEFKIIHPGAKQWSDNDSSCVLKIRYKDLAILLPGDIEKRAEEQLLLNYPNGLNADILVAPHHGSNTSSSVKFIQAVSPKIVIFSAGRNNRYGLPKLEIEKRYQDLGSQTFTTWQSGAITISYPDEKLQVEEYRKQFTRFWHYKSE